MYYKRFIGIAIVGCAILFSGCGGKKVTRIEADSQTDLSGKWNDTDSRLVAESMIQDCLSKPWYENWRSQNGGRIPVIIIGDVRNKSHEHINIETFTKDIERELLNSGLVQFVAGQRERGQLREEKADQQQGFTAEESASRADNETGADIMLIGSINTIVDQEGNKSVVFYKTDLELIELESNRKLWIGDKKIKKIISRSRTKF